MHSRNQNVPPRTPGNNKKEALKEVSMDKRRRLTVGKMVRPNTTNMRPRLVLSTVNASRAVGGHGDTMSVAASDAGSSGGGVEFNSREDVERPLGEKMKGKLKSDFKGKSEQMAEYIKKLKSCIKWFMELEDGYLAEIEKLKSMAEFEEKRHEGIGAEATKKVKEIYADISNSTNEAESEEEGGAPAGE